MCNVDSLDNPRRFSQAKGLLKLEHSLFWIVYERLGLPEFLFPFLRPRPQGIESLDLIAQSRRPLKIQISGRLDHLLFQIAKDGLFSSIEKTDEPADVLGIG